MKFIKTKPYLRAAKKIGITPQDEARLFDELTQTPEKGDLIIGAGGIRKIRLALGNRGKSAGARILYALYEIDEELYLLWAYAKANQSNIKQSELNVLKAFVDTIRKDGLNG